jgi:hypothetical protein
LSTFWILDERDVWHQAACDAARRHGHSAKRIFSGDIDTAAMRPGDIGFIRPHADWRRLPQNRRDDLRMREHLLMIQDAAQVLVYEDKSAQLGLWGAFMPYTRRFDNADDAHWFVENADYPLVSKADVGASSTNVRILQTPAEARAHVAKLFGEGILVHHGANCPRTLQRGYALLQEFIPHKVTYRVNAIGDARAVFFRYCYPDKPVAQTGNVEPAFEMTPELDSLLAYADEVFTVIGSKWCALDILKDERTPDQAWRLLETSLAWPWPSPGRCNEGAIFRSGGKRWIDMFDVMFDQVEAGAWSAAH